jgi:hypothetical protein
MINLAMQIELLVSILNNYLRNKYKDLETLCDIEDVDIEELTKKLKEHNYWYDQEQNKIKQD